MPNPGNSDRRYEVHCSAVIAAELRHLQHEAPGVARKRAIAEAFRKVIRQLQFDPNEVGEPLYRLAVLRLQVRTCSVRPLVVDFAVSEEHPLVFIKGVKLLPEKAK
jgi:hypothetical protein